MLDFKRLTTMKPMIINKLVAEVNGKIVEL